MMLMICAIGALRLWRYMCGALALDGVLWKFINEFLGHALTGFATTTT